LFCGQGACAHGHLSLAHIAGTRDRQKYFRNAG
jgi:hypothetical protein